MLQGGREERGIRLEMGPRLGVEEGLGREGFEDGLERGNLCPTDDDDLPDDTTAPLASHSTPRQPFSRPPQASNDHRQRNPSPPSKRPTDTRVPSRSSVVRKSIARVLTVVNQKTRANLRELYKNKKHLPLDLRAKKTRAIRRRLTKVRLRPSRAV